jgi:hypothetical protein
MGKKPRFTHKPTTDKPFIDWKRKYYIDGVRDEDYATAIWEDWILQSFRVGRFTPTQRLTKMFRTHRFLKQIDIPGDEDRSSDVVLQEIKLQYARGQALIIKGCAHTYGTGISVSEHSVRQHWSRAGHAPDLAAICLTPFYSEIVDDQVACDGALATEQGLFLGEMQVDMQGHLCINPRSNDYDQDLDQPQLMFRCKTFVSNNLLRDEQLELQADLLTAYAQRRKQQ